MPHPPRRLLALALTLLFAAASPPALSQDTPSDDPAAAKRDALPAEVKHAIEEVANSLLQVQQRDVALACDKGVENTRWSIETMLDVGQRNVDSGHLARSEYEPTAAKLRTLLDGVSLQDCEAATGAKRDFYACMSSDYNHALACADEHRF